MRGKVVLIVGASSGIGRLFAVAAAKRGALVAVSARREALLETLATEIRAQGGQCLVVAVDALDDAACQAMVDAVAAHYGRIDVALLNAGGAGAMDSRVLTAADVTRCMRQNYDVVVNPMMPVLGYMSRQGRGVVMTTNSLAGFVPLPLQGPYSAAKGALRLLVDTCRLEYENRGISFVTLHPGFVSTEAHRCDGMPSEHEVSPERAVRHFMKALDQQKPDHLFPLRPVLQIRAGLLLPRRLQRKILAEFVQPDPRACSDDEAPAGVAALVSGSATATAGRRHLAPAAAPVVEGV